MHSFRVASLAGALVVFACVTAVPPAGARPFEILQAFDNPPAVPWGGLVQAPDGFIYGTTQHGGKYDRGTIFRFDAATGLLTVLHHFTGAEDGMHPMAALVWGGDALYGTTAGTAGFWSSSTVKGTVFRITTDGALSTLHTFAGPDGVWPRGVLVLVGDLLWGTTQAGGALGYGTVFSIGRSGVLTTVHSFSYGAEGYFPLSGLAAGPDGTLFGTTSDGGSASRGTLFKIDPAGQFATLHSFTAADGKPVGEVLVEASGALVGATLSGALYSGGTVYRHLPEGIHQVLNNLPANTLPASGLVQGPGGVLHGVTYGANLTYGWASLYSLDPATGALQTLYYFGAANPEGRLLVVGNDLIGTTAGYDSDPDRGTIFRFSTGDRSLTTLHQFGVAAAGCTPIGLAAGGDGTLFGTTEYCGEAGGGTVFELTPAGARTVYAFPYSPRWVESRETPSGRTSMTVSRVSWVGEDLLYGVRRSETSEYRNYGSVFQLVPSTGDREILHQFDVRVDGAAPEYPPTLASDGTARGTASEGEATYRGGVLYSMGVDGSGYEVTHRFANDAGGQGPSSPLLEASDGGLYGTTALTPVTIDGNSYSGCGGVFRVNEDTGELTDSYTFPWSPGSYPSGCQPRGTLAEGPRGRIYGATTYGNGVPGFGGSGYGVVYELDPTVRPWNARIVHAFTPGAGGAYPHDLVYAADGFFYGAAQQGSHDKGIVYRLRPDGSGFEVVHDFDGDDGSEPGELVVGSDKNLYGVTRMGGPGGGGVVFRIALATASIDGPDTVAEGDRVTLTASGEDPAGGAVTFTWDLDQDGVFDDFSGAELEFVAGDGPHVYLVAVRVTTNSGMFADASAQVTVENVAPDVQIQPSSTTAMLGADVVLRVTFEDPGPDAWTARVDFGDGTTETRALDTPGSFELSHVYSAPGVHAVSVTVTDDDGASGTAGATVEVGTPADAVEWLIDAVNELMRDGTLNGGQGNSLILKLKRALLELRAGDVASAIRRLETFIHEVNGLASGGVLSEAEARSLIDVAQAAIDSVSA